MVTVSQSSGQYDDKTKLRHNRMGHINDEGMIKSELELFCGDITGKVKPNEAYVRDMQSRVKFSSFNTQVWGFSLVKSHGGCQ